MVKIFVDANNRIKDGIDECFERKLLCLTCFWSLFWKIVKQLTFQMICDMLGWSFYKYMSESSFNLWNFASHY